MAASDGGDRRSRCVVARARGRLSVWQAPSLGPHVRTGCVRLMGGGDTDKEVKPAPPPLITSMPLMPAVDQTPLMQSHPGGSSLASFGAPPMPASMLMTPAAWSSLLDPNPLQ